MRHLNSNSTFAAIDSAKTVPVARIVFGILFLMRMDENVFFFAETHAGANIKSAEN